MSLFEPYQDKPLCLILSDVPENTKRNLLSAIELEGGRSFAEWDENSVREPDLEYNRILLYPYFSERIISAVQDWSFEISVIGNLDRQKKELLFRSFISSYWNISTASPFSISQMFGKKIRQKSLRALIWTKNRLFNAHIGNLLKYYSCRSVLTENPEYARQTLNDSDYDILIVDWDNSGQETGVLIRDLRRLKEIKRNFPIVLGIKDFNRMNLFKDLSAGIKDFSKVLFNAREILQVLLHSFPVEEPFNASDYEDFPVIQSDQNGLYLDYKKENSEFRKQIHTLEKKYQSLIFARQFEWLSDFL